jgi:LPXTG-motif cell wall-anchored protein
MKKRAGDFIMKSLLSKALKWVVSVLMVLVMCPTMTTQVFAGNVTYSTSLNDLVDSFSMDGVQKQSDGYHVQADTEYKIHLGFKENATTQFTNNAAGVMTYTLPDGFTMLSGRSGSIDITVNDGTSYTISDNTYSVNGNVLTFKFNINDKNYSHLAAAANANFVLDFSGSFQGETRTVPWGGNATCTFTISNDKHVDIVKDAWWDNGKIRYRLTLTSTGTNNNIVVTDAFNDGSLLTLDQDSIAFEDGKTGTISNKSGKGFTATVATMSHNEVVKITYTATVNYKGVDDNYGTYDQTLNTATVKSNEHPDPETVKKDLTNWFNYTSIEKSGEYNSNKDNGTADRYIDWHIVYNKDMKGSVAGRTITDTLNADNVRDYNLRYTGNATVTVTKPDKTTETRTIRIDTSKSTFTYTIPDTDTTANKYEITYETVADMSNRSVSTWLDNSAQDNFGHTSNGQGSWVGPNEDKKIEASKTATEVTQATTTWKISLTVPAAGLDRAVATDYLPGIMGNADGIGYTHLFDTLDDPNNKASYKVEGLKSGESWSLNYQETSNQYDHSQDQHTATFTFYKDSDQKTAGLQKSTDGKARTITITYTVNNNTDWVKDSMTNSQFNDHKNTVCFSGNGQDTWTDGHAYPPVYSMNKYVDNNGASNLKAADGMPVYAFHIDLRGFATEDTTTITDTFDRTYFTAAQNADVPYNHPTVIFYKSDSYTEVGRIEPTITSTDTGATISFNKDQIPAEAMYARIYYGLKINDSTALAALNVLAAQNNADCSYPVTNSAEYHGITNEVSAKYSYPSVSKTVTEDHFYPNDDSQPYGVYQIVVNPNSLDMIPATATNKGNSLQVVDNSSSNLSIDYQSIAVVYADGTDSKTDGITTWNVDGNTINLTIQDSKKATITYKAKVVSTADSTASNTVTLNGYESKVDKWAKGRQSGKGSADVYSLIIMKTQLGATNVVIPGVTFALLDSNKQAVTDKNNKPVTVTTGADGTVLLKGSMDADGWTLFDNTDYYLQETNTPAGYAENDTYYQFKIGAASNYSEYTYANGETIMIRNMHLVDSTVSKVWDDASDQDGIRPDHLDVTLVGKTADGTVVYNAENTATTLNAGNNWTATVPNLPRTTADGKKITYKWSEKLEDTKYTAGAPAITATANTDKNDAESTTFTNTHTPDTKDVDVYKTWEDSKNQDGVRPASVTYQLFKSVGDSTPVAVDGKTITLTGDSKADTWTAKFEKLPVNENGKTITYSVKETNIDSNYTVDTEKTTALNVANKHTPSVKNVTVNKVWDDEGNKEGFRPDNVVFQLQKTVNGVTNDVKGKNYTLTAKNVDATDFNKWSYTFENLPEKENGQTITYSVKETSSNPNYTPDKDDTDLTVTNSRTVDMTATASGTKTWNDTNNEGARPTSITVYLHANGSTEAVQTKTVSADAQGNWTYTFTGLQKYAGGQPITYSVTEDAPANYTAAADGMNLTNTYAPGETSVTVTKNWNDQVDAYGTRPESIKVQLYADDVKQGDEVELNANSATPWTYTWSKLNKTQNGKEIAYTVKEVNVPNGYDNTTVVATKDNGYTLVNTRNTANLVIKKTFAGDTITEDDQKNLNFEVTGQNNYDKTFNYGKDFKNGILTIPNLAVGDYTVKEVNSAIKGYNVTVKYTVNGTDSTESGKATLEKNGSSEVDITDSYAKKGNLVIHKTFDGDDVTKEDLTKLTFEITKPDKTTETIHLADFAKNADGTYTYTMPQAEDGEYTVHESNAEIDGYDVTVTTTVKGEEKETTSVASNQNGVVEIKDSYAKWGNLAIKKTITGTVTKEDKDKLNFEVKGPNGYDETFNYGEDFTDGVLTLKNVTPGEYTVEEKNAEIDGYNLKTTVTVNGNETNKIISKPDTDSMIEITNDYSAWGNFVIHKTFDGDDVTKEDLTNLQFEITKPDGKTEVKHLSDFAKNDDGTYTYIVTRAAKGEYTVHETNPEIKGYDVTVTTTVNGDDTNKTTVSTKQNGVVEIKDSYATLGNLVIHKTFDGDNITDEDKANLKFDITSPDGKTTTVGFDQFTKNDDGTYTYTIEKVADGKYTVEETNPEIKGYDVTVTTTVNGDQGNTTEVKPHQNGVVEIKDSYALKGNLVIKKTFDGDNITDEDKANLKFDITSPDGKTTTVGLDQFTKNDDGTYTYTIEQAEDGKYTVEETNAEIKGYDVTVTTTVNGEKGNTTEVVPHQNGEVDIKNSYTHNIANLIIKKSFDGDNVTEEDKANLKFEITYPDGTTKTVAYSEFKNGEYTLTDVPTGKYSVREVNPEIAGYNVTVTTTVEGKEGNSTTLVPHATSEIDIKDTYTTPETPKTPSTPTPTPETPSTPETPTTPKTPDRPATPNTGDQTNAPLAAGVMGFAMLAAGFAIFFKKKYSD